MFAIELRRERLRVPGRGPPHVGDLRDGASVGTGVAVTVEAPAHAERRHLGDRFHLVDATVAGDTADSPRHVHVVREIGVVGKIVDANPAHRLVVRGAGSNRCERLTVPHHGQMAVHAGLRGRNVRNGGYLDRGMTIPTIDIELAGVEFVAVRDGLNGTVADVCIPGGKKVPDSRNCEHRDEHTADRGHDRELVPTRGKNLRQTATTPGL